MKPLVIRPEWRTSTVVELCRSMREAQDFSALPILADALQDADRGDDELLARLRGPSTGYAGDAALTACVLSRDAADAVAWLVNFADTHDCPGFETLFNAATGNHHLNTRDDHGEYFNSSVQDWGESYLHFGGSDAHGDIPPEFWDKVELVAGKRIHERPSQFSCSC